MDEHSSSRATLMPVSMSNDLFDMQLARNEKLNDDRQQDEIFGVGRLLEGSQCTQTMCFERAKLLAWLNSLAVSGTK